VKVTPFPTLPFPALPCASKLVETGV
jgi:hypothetical protein